jgi:hypothetical protein
VDWFFAGVWIWTDTGWSSVLRQGPTQTTEGQARALFDNERWTTFSQPPAVSGLWRWTDQGWELEDTHRNF